MPPKRGKKEIMRAVDDSGLCQGGFSIKIPKSQPKPRRVRKVARVMGWGIIVKERYLEKFLYESKEDAGSYINRLSYSRFDEIQKEAKMMRIVPVELVEVVRK